MRILTVLRGRPRVTLVGLPFLFLVSASVGAAEPSRVVRGGEVSAPVTAFVVDVDVRDLPSPLPWKPGDPVREIPMRHYFPPGTAPVAAPGLPVDPLLDQQLDRLAPASRGAGSFSTPTRTFAGLGYTGVNPPDTNGDVGPNHYIQSINAAGGADVRIWDKAEPTPNVLATFRLDTLGSGVCAAGLGDPIVLYDREADRWLITEFSSGGNNLCVYVSQTADPVGGGWFFYGFAMTTFPDYPKYAVWSTDANGGQGSYVVTANDGGPGVIALDRGAMLAGGAATFQRLSMPGLPGFGIQGPAPVAPEGPTPPPAGEPAIVLRHRDTEIHSGPSAPGDVLEMWLFDVDWVTPANTTLIQGPDIGVSEFDSTVCGTAFVGCFAQPGSSTALMPIREVIMNRAQYLHHEGFETIVGSFVVDVATNDQGGVRWFELRRSGGGPWSVAQEGTYSIDSDNRWMSSIAMDQGANIALAYNVASSSTFPSLRYTGREDGDTPGVMTQPEGTIHDGTAANSSFRYGDYASMDLDPTDDCTFWFTGMDNTSGSWRTQVASFAFERCGCEAEPSPLVVTAQVTGDNEIELSWNDSDLSTVTEYSVSRSRVAGGPYETIATVADTSPGIAGGADTFYTDTDVSGGTTYHYVVRASDGDLCESDASVEVAQTATGACTLPPIFAGLQTLTAPAVAECTLSLTWSPGTEECGGPVAYNVYRSTSPAFTPGAGNLLASGVIGGGFEDVEQLVDGLSYFYVVRAMDTSNGAEEDNSVELSGVPLTGGAGLCTTTSSCADNPFIDVQPDGLTTACEKSGFALTAVAAGGTGPFAYQWSRDGVDIPGAVGATYAPDLLGTHTYNVRAQAAACPGSIFDGQDSSVELVNAPFFAGAASVTNPQTATCGLEVSWDPGVTVCDGPVRYFVYRDTVSPVATTPANLVAAGVLETSFVDSAELLTDTTYRYLVRAQDVSTGQLDSNTVEVAAFPDGPGSGPQAVLDEDFEDPATFADWTVTTGPGVHTCGEWALDTDGASQPPGASGSYAIADNQCHPLLGRTSSTLTSPVVDVNLANLVSVSLEYDIWYNHDGGETGKVEVFDGSGWVTVWQDADADLAGRQVLDVTPYAAGNASFQVRFDYQDATQDQWFSVDNVQVIALIDVDCQTAAPGPPAVPDGAGATVPLRGDRVTEAGDTIGVTWDGATCAGADYNLLYGDLAGVSALTLLGSDCGIGVSGSHTWTAVPAGDLFFLVVGTDGAGTEGGWGLDGSGGERNGLTASGECANTVKDAANSCP